MTTVNRTVESEQHRQMAAKLIESRALPFTLTLTDGKHRSTAQNKLQHMWMSEIAQQKGDMTTEEVRAYCKLTIGVPLLRAENEAFRMRYDEVVRPLSYEQKLAIMSEPFDFGVTRLMTTKQKTQYLDAIAKHFGEQGIILSMPEELRNEIPNPGDVHSPTSAGNDESGSPAPSLPDHQTAPSDAGKTEEEPAGNPDAPNSATGSSSPTLFTFKFSDAELSHLKDFARKALDDAAGDGLAEAREVAIERMTMNYREAVDSKDAHAALEAMQMPLATVVKRKRSREQAADYIARDILGCEASELEGRRNG